MKRELCPSAPVLVELQHYPPPKRPAVLDNSHILNRENLLPGLTVIVPQGLSSFSAERVLFCTAPSVLPSDFLNVDVEGAAPFRAAMSSPKTV